MASFEQIQKTYRSIRAHQARGGSANTQRGRSLIARYDAQKKAIAESGLYRSVWAAHCATFNASPEHTAWDLFC